MNTFKHVRRLKSTIVTSLISFRVTIFSFSGSVFEPTLQSAVRSRCLLFTRNSAVISLGGLTSLASLYCWWSSFTRSFVVTIYDIWPNKRDQREVMRGRWMSGKTRGDHLQASCVIGASLRINMTVCFCLPLHKFTQLSPTLESALLCGNGTDCHLFHQHFTRSATSLKTDACQLWVCFFFLLFIYWTLMLVSSLLFHTKVCQTSLLLLDYKNNNIYCKGKTLTSVRNSSQHTDFATVSIFSADGKLQCFY